MRITNKRPHFAKAVLCSAITLALLGCGEESLKSQMPQGGNGSGGEDVQTISVAPDYKMDLSSPFDFEGAVTELGAMNPDSSTMPLSTVIKTYRNPDAKPWAGTILSDTKTLELSDERSVITAWVYSPEVDIPIVFKVENKDNSDEFAEVEVKTTKANEWELLTFDFTKLSNGELNPDFTYNQKVIFFNFMSEENDKVFYWDNVRHEGYGLLEQPMPVSYPMSDSGQPLLGNPDYQAISYGAWRTTERKTDSDTVPSIEEQMEDMKILSAMGIKMIRTYNTQGFKGLDGLSNTENLLEAIKQLKDNDANFEMYVMLGVWIDALNSWTGNTIDSSQDSPNNVLEISKAKELALKYPDIVKVIAVGNEAMVDWAASYKVHPSIILNHVNELQSWKLEDDATKDIWITTSDNWAVWAGQDPNANHNDQADLKELIKAVDYVSLHTYAFHDTHYHPTLKEQWKVPLEDQNLLTKEEQINNSMDAAYQHSVEQFAQAQQFIHRVDPNKPIHIGETGWASVSSDLYGEGGTQAADEYKQKRFHDDMRDFADDQGASLFFFQAFDEPWKGGNDAGHSEKHFGLIDIDCKVKFAAWDKVQALTDLMLTRSNCSEPFSASYGGVIAELMNDVLSPPYAPEPQPDLPILDGEFRVLGATAFDGAQAFGWEGTAWAGIDEYGVLTVATSPNTAKEWGWGAHIGDGNPRDFTNIKTLRFDIRGNTESKNLAEFGFGVGFQSDTGGQWASNHAIRFNEGAYTLTTEWQTIEVDMSQFSGIPELSKVVAPFMVHNEGTAGLTDADIQFRNISWFE